MGLITGAAEAKPKAPIKILWGLFLVLGSLLHMQLKDLSLSAIFVESLTSQYNIQEFHTWGIHSSPRTLSLTFIY